MSKKIIALLMASLMLIGFVSGCASNGGDGTTTEATTTAGGGATTTAPPATTQPTPEKKDYTLRAWVFQTFSSALDDMVIARVQEFSQTYGVNVVIETVPETTFTSKFTAAVEAGSLPDVIACRADHINITYPNVPFLPLTDIIPQIEADTGRKFLQKGIDNNSADGIPYAIPFMLSGQPAVYNAAAFKEAGYDVLPDTWDEVLEACRAVSKPDEGYYGFGVGCGPTDNDGETLLRFWLWGEGGRLFDVNGNPDPANPETIEVIQKYVDLYNDGAVAPSATTWDAAGNNKSYMLGESALCYNPFTVINAIKEPGYEELYANTAAASLPKGKDGVYNMCNAASFAINAKTNYVEDSAALLTYLCDKEWYNSWIEQSAPLMAPTFEDSTEEAIWQDDPLAKIMVELNFESKLGWFGYPCETPDGKKAGALVFNNYLLGKAITRILTEGLTVEEGMQRLKQDMEDLLRS